MTMKFSTSALVALTLFSVESHAGGSKKGSKGSKGSKGKGQGGGFCPAACIDPNRNLASYSYSYHDEHELYPDGYLECCLEWNFFPGIEYQCNGLGGGFMSVFAPDRMQQFHCCPNDCADQVYNRRDCFGPFYWAPGSKASKLIGQLPPRGCAAEPPPPPPPPKGKGGKGGLMMENPREGDEGATTAEPDEGRERDLEEAGAPEEEERRRLELVGIPINGRPGPFCDQYMQAKYGMRGPWIEVFVASGPIDPPRPRFGRNLEGADGRELSTPSGPPPPNCAMYVYCCRDQENAD